MNIEFRVPYVTRPGESLYIIGDIAKIWGDSGLPMLYSGDGMWCISLKIKERESFRYSYLLRDDNGDTVYEAGAARRFKRGGYRDYTIVDEWRVYTDETPFLSRAFKKVLFKREALSESCKSKRGDIQIICSANNLDMSEQLLITGSCAELGGWDLSLAKRMEINIEGAWEVTLDSKALPSIFEYKFVVMRGSSYRWEEGENRALSIPKLSKRRVFIVNHFSLNLQAPKPRYRGTAVALFSVKGETSCGIGDFDDLLKVVDLLVKSGQQVLQILPINDTTATHSWRDSYPYSAISVYAIHPIYISLYSVGIVGDSQFMDYFRGEAERLNSLEAVEYESVERLKWEYLRRIYEEDGERVLNSVSFKQFFRRNREWLRPYSAFCYLRDLYGTADFNRWGRYRRYRVDEIRGLLSKRGAHYKQIAIHYFVQYHLAEQLKRVHEYANNSGIIVKGDIPIGVSRYSVEAWSQPQYFNFNGAAGAPPDQFSKDGQNWGFPTYNWRGIEEENFSFWKKRLYSMSKYFDAYRIDHLLGFFRIWEIPYSSIDGVLGHFSPALPYSKEEIDGYGYNFDYERDCKPFIRESLLESYFGREREAIVAHFFDKIEPDGYRFKDQYRSQRELYNYLITNDRFRDGEICAKLMSLYREILFVEDPCDEGGYHPAISAMDSLSYKVLSDRDREAYRSLHGEFFYRRNGELWKKSAISKLYPLLSATDMLVCAEDLGMIPDCVPEVMRKFALLSLEIERMPKDCGALFASPSKYPYLSVCTTGTHDTSSIRAWWEEDAERSQLYYNSVLKQAGIAPLYCTEEICKMIISMHLSAPSMLTILPIQDWLSISAEYRCEDPIKERINIPSDPNHYWNYRMSATIEKILNDTRLIEEIKSL